MEKEFVPYELALRMKALGFDEPCLAIHSNANPKTGLYTLNKYRLKLIKQGSQKNKGVKAPLYQQAFKWIMQFPPLNKWACNIAVYSDGTYSIKDGKYAVHEYLSLEECLDKLLEIVESKSE